MSDRHHSPLRWIGGKSRLAWMLELILEDWGNEKQYFEPFFGSGALFFRLKANGARINDKNPHLMEFFRFLRDDTSTLIGYVEGLPREVTRERYLALRDRFNSLEACAERAGIFLFLNRTCFNGIWRVSRSGKFNVPFGRKFEPMYPNNKTLESLAEKLRGATMSCLDFADAGGDIGANYVAYLDPPYPPLNSTSFFTHYTKERFGFNDHCRVAQFAEDLVGKQVDVLISLSDSEQMRSLYHRFYQYGFEFPRFVSAGGQKSAVRDLLVTSRPIERLGRMELRVRLLHSPRDSLYAGDLPAAPSNCSWSVV